MIADILSSLEATDGRGVMVNELGKIKIGGKGDERQSGGGKTFRPPVKHDYFTVTTLNRQPNGDLVADDQLMQQLVAEGHGDKDGYLRQLPIRVLTDNIDDIMQSGFVWYVGKTCGARSDGKTVTWFVDPDTRRRHEKPVTEDHYPELMEWKDQNGKKLFKLHSTFNCVIASRNARWGGVYKFRTTSVVTFRQLHASFVLIRQLTGGVLVNMPIMLVVRPIQVSPEGKATTVYVVHAELRGDDMIDLQRQALEQVRFKLEFKAQVEEANVEYRKLLAAPGTESERDTGDIIDEFAPEQAEPEPAPAHYGLLDDTPAQATEARTKQIGVAPPANDPPATSMFGDDTFDGESALIGGDK